jgi:hypothetical protein
MNLELFNRAVEIIAAIPEKQINLRLWLSHSFDENCGTICCAGGWLARHPEMQAQGLYCGAYGAPSCKGPNGMIFTEYYALAFFFDMPFPVAASLFDTRSYSRAKWESQFKTDKELWLARVELFRQNRLK